MDHYDRHKSDAVVEAPHKVADYVKDQHYTSVYQISIFINEVGANPNLTRHDK